MPSSGAVARISPAQFSPNDWLNMRRKDERLSADVGAVLCSTAAGLLQVQSTIGGEILRGCVGAVIGKFLGGKLNSHSQVFLPSPRLDRWSSFHLNTSNSNCGWNGNDWKVHTLRNNSVQ